MPSEPEGGELLDDLGMPCPAVRDPPCQGVAGTDPTDPAGEFGPEGFGSLWAEVAPAPGRDSPRSDSAPGAGRAAVRLHRLDRLYPGEEVGDGVGDLGGELVEVFAQLGDGLGL